MHAIKTPSFFRPSSRPTSPAPPAKFEVASNAYERNRPLSKLALASFRRPSPAPTTPQAVTPLVQDGSYLEVLSLKLSEAVTRALAQPTGPALPHEQLGGKRPIPASRGHALGALISGEINASQDNPHLQRAIVRSLQRPLSVLLSNISAHLLPLTSSPQFSATTLSQQSCLNVTQLHAVGLATLAGEVLESFDELALGLEIDGRSDGLKVIRDGLLNLVTRVVNPLIASIQSELLPLIDGLERSSPIGRTGSGLNSKNVKAPHPSITALHAVVPLYAKGLAKIAAVDAAQSSLGAMLITLVWHGLVALAHRPFISGSPPASPKLTSVTTKPKIKPSTPPASPSPRFMTILPPSRPSTPPNHQSGSSLPGEARAFFDALGLIAKPSKDKAAGLLASEAVDEAFAALESLVSLFDLIYANPRSEAALNFEQLEADLIPVTDNLPTLIGLPILLRVYVVGQGSQEGGDLRSVASMLGITEDSYRGNCLTDFSRADECEEAVGKHIISVLRNDSATFGAAMVANWLERQIRDVR